MDVQTLLLPYIKKRQDGCKSSFFRCQKYLNGLTIAHPYLPRRLKILFNVQKYSACPASLFTSNIISKCGRCMRNLLFAEGTNRYSSCIFKLDSYFRINNFHNSTHVWTVCHQVTRRLPYLERIGYFAYYRLPFTQCFLHRYLN